MLNRLRKRLQSLFTQTLSATEEPESTPISSDNVASAVATGPGSTDAPDSADTSDLQAAALARREARKREARLILSERIHNRSSTLLSELRNQLLRDLQARLEKETASRDLKEVLQVTLDPAFTRALDTAIQEHVETLLRTLRREFEEEPESASLLPAAQALTGELKAYRDQILRTYLLEQLEVFALPPQSSAFPDGKVTPAELQQRIALYWRSCREALDRFFRSVEMALLNGARPGIRLDAALIRESLVAAQYRNGYRALDERFRSWYSKVADLQMVSSTSKMEKERPVMDRQVVDEVIVPLAYFIRHRREPEPREALQTRAELFREILDKLVASSDPFHQTAEAVKPLLRRSIDQARPLALQTFPYLRPAIESLKPAAIHRATALLHLLEVLVQPELDESHLEKVEHDVRLNKPQYHLYLHLSRNYPAELQKLQPLERFQPADAEFLTHYVAEWTPPGPAVEDMARKLGYLELPEPSPEDVRSLLRGLAVLTLPRQELPTWHCLYDPQPPRREDLEHLAKAAVNGLHPTHIGPDERLAQVGAAPLPLDLSKALAASGYHPGENDRVSQFRRELRELITAGEAPELARAFELLHGLRQAAEEERISLGSVGTDGDPYVTEVWLKDTGTLVGLLFYRGPGFGKAPIEIMTRDPAGSKRGEVERKLRRQLTNQAIIYRAFHKLFSNRKELSRQRRQALPSYLKITYEPILPHRHVLLAHLRNARALLQRIHEFSSFIQEADGEARSDAATVAQILSRLLNKIEQLSQAAESTRAKADLARIGREYERVLKYLNIAILHSVNPWLDGQTRGLATEFEFREEEVEDAIRQEAASRGLDWDQDVKRWEGHPIHGTLGCRALLRLVDGSSKVLRLEYDRRRRAWLVKHYGPRLTDVVSEALQKHGRSLPDDYDEKYEQPTFSLNEQLCRFLFVKKGVARVEATLVLDSSDTETPWEVAFLKWNEDVLVDRGQSPGEQTL